jgi:hypothetical protein
LVCWMSSKQVWSQWLVVVAAHLFSQCNVAWRSFLWARGSGRGSFDSSCCLISAKCGSSISARFLVHGAHAVCFCTIVANMYRPDTQVFRWYFQNHELNNDTLRRKEDKSRKHNKSWYIYAKMLE